MISLETLQWKRASSLLEGRITWFFSSCGRSLSSYDWDLRDPLVLPQESPVTMRVARGLSGFLSSQCCDLGPHLELRTEPHFLTSADMDLGVSLKFPQESQASYRVETCMSTFLPSSTSSVRLLGKLTQGSVAFPLVATGLSHVPLWG